MKALLMGFIFLSFSPNKMLIQSYHPDAEMDYQMVLALPTPDKRVFLDCQSFFNAIYYQSAVNGEWKDDWSLIIGGGVCNEIAEYAKVRLDAGSPFCLSVNLNEKLVDVSDDIDECR